MSGSNTLHLSAAIGCEKVFQELTEAGLSVTVQDEAYNTPVDCALKRSQIGIVLWLLNTYKLKEVDLAAAIRYASSNKRYDVIREITRSYRHALPGVWGSWWRYLSSLIDPTEAEVDLVSELSGSETSDTHMLHYFAARCDISQAKEVFGTCTSWERGYKESLLDWAISYRKTALALALIETDGVDINANQALLSSAVSSGDVRLVEGLLDRGVNLGAADEDNNPLLRAVRDGRLDMVKVLVARNARIDPPTDTVVGPESETVLTAAVTNPEILEYLLQRSSRSLELKNGWGKTPLHEAVNRGNYKSTILLLDYGADIEATVSDTGETSLHLAAARSSYEIFKLLLERGANMNKMCNRRRSVLAHAAQGSSEAILTYFLNHGTSVDARVHDDRTILHEAALSVNGVRNLILLLRLKANIDAQDRYGKTAVHLASEYRLYARALRLLLEFGGDISLRDVNGETALFAAVRQFCSKGYAAAELLLHGADRSIINFEGKTVGDLARESCIQQLLLEPRTGLETIRDNAWEYEVHRIY